MVHPYELKQLVVMLELAPTSVVQGSVTSQPPYSMPCSQHLLSAGLVQDLVPFSIAHLSTYLHCPPR